MTIRMYASSYLSEDEPSFAPCALHMALRCLQTLKGCILISQCLGIRRQSIIMSSDMSWLSCNLFATHFSTASRGDKAVLAVSL